MASGFSKRLKRRRLGGGGDGQQWQRCHSGFDEEIILNEQYLGISRLGRGRRKAELKLLPRSTAEVPPLAEKDADIDWESSSSDDSCPASPPILPSSDRREKPPMRAAQWLSTCLRPATLGGVPPSGEDPELEEGIALIDDKEDGSGEKPLAGADAIDEASISDYESSEAPSPSAEIPLKPTPASPAVTPTQSPMISSYGQSTQDTANDSPATTSSQWVKKLQQATPEKGADYKGSPITDRTEGKDSAKKNKKFKSCGLAERLKKLMNREKSDIAFWHHQSSSQLEASGGARCCIKIETINPVQGLYLTHCRNLSTSSADCASSAPVLPAELVVLFHRKTLLDENIQAGSTVHIYPPWQRLELPESSETVLLCTYYCKATGEGGPGLTSPMADATSTEVETPRPVFRPSRLFSGRLTSPRACLNSTPLSQNKPQPQATSLLGALAVKGPSFDFEFSLHVLVLRVCKLVATRPVLEEQRWRLLVQDRDRTTFEVQMTTDEREDMKSWEGKVVNAGGLKISQRTTRARNPSLFSMIDSFTRDMSPAAVPDEPVTGRPLPSISYIVNLRNPMMLAECKDITTWGRPNPLRDTSLYEVCQRLDEVHRVSLHGVLIHATPKEPTDLLPSTTPRPGTHLLLITDPSLSGKPTSDEQNNSGRNYVMVEKLPSCLLERSGVSDLFQEWKGLIVRMEHVFVNGGTLSLDCYSSIARVSSDGSTDTGPRSIGRFSVDDCPRASYPPLSLSVAENTLVSVTGVMSGVDEDTAYTWPVCDVCESNRLKGDESGDKLHCLSCGRDVSSPITRIHLQILVQCSTLDETNSIKVKLKQGTVTDLFGDPSSEEPFDLKRILGRPYGPTHCFVRRCARVDTGRRDVELEEI